MPRPSEDFVRDLNEVDTLLEAAGQILVSLHDLAEYEGLPREVVRRLQTKGTVNRITRESLAEIHAMAGAK